jgi:hypothetical protein
LGIIQGIFAPEPKDAYVNNRKVDDVIVTHANSIILYHLPPGAKRFTAKAALLRSGIEQEGSQSSVTFEVYTDIPEEKIKALVRERNAY